MTGCGVITPRCFVCLWQTYDYTRHIIVQRGAAIYKVNVLDEKFL